MHAFLTLPSLLVVPLLTIENDIYNSYSMYNIDLYLIATLLIRLRQGPLVQVSYGKCPCSENTLDRWACNI